MFYVPAAGSAPFTFALRATTAIILKQWQGTTRPRRQHLFMFHAVVCVCVCTHSCGSPAALISEQTPLGGHFDHRVYSLFLFCCLNNWAVSRWSDRIWYKDTCLHSPPCCLCYVVLLHSDCFFNFTSFFCIRNVSFFWIHIKSPHLEMPSKWNL